MHLGQNFFRLTLGGGSVDNQRQTERRTKRAIYADNTPVGVLSE